MIVRSKNGIFVARHEWNNLLLQLRRGGASHQPALRQLHPVSAACATCHVSRDTCLVLTSPRGGRTEQGYCSVSYVAYDSTSFRISNTIPSTSAAIAQIGED